MTEARVAVVVVALIAILVVIAVALASGPTTPQSFPDGREGPGDIVDNDHDDYPHDCLAEISALRFRCRSRAGVKPLIRRQ